MILWWDSKQVMATENSLGRWPRHSVMSSLKTARECGHTKLSIITVKHTHRTVPLCNNDSLFVTLYHYFIILLVWKWDLYQSISQNGICLAQIHIRSKCLASLRRWLFYINTCQRHSLSPSAADHVSSSFAATRPGWGAGHPWFHSSKLPTLLIVFMLLCTWRGWGVPAPWPPARLALSRCHFPPAGSHAVPGQETKTHG